MNSPYEFETRETTKTVDEKAAPGDEGRKQDAPSPSATSKAVEMLKDLDYEPWHAPDGTAYVTVVLQDKSRPRREHYAVDSRTFRLLLRKEFFARRSGRTLPRPALEAVIELVQAKALFEGPTHNAHVRTASVDGRVYVDLCNAAWEVVEVDASGFRISSDPPVRFVRTPGMLPLPSPAPLADASILADLPHLLGIPHDPGLLSLVLGYLVGTFNPVPIYPVLVVGGPQGSGKSTFVDRVRALVDPSEVSSQAPPRNYEDLMVTAANSFLVSFDNVSDLGPTLSDGICRLATGGGSRARRRYTDREETLISVARPVVLNGITDVVFRDDLASRSIFVRLPSLSPNDRRRRVEMDSAFVDAHARLLGSLFHCVSVGLAGLPSVDTEGLPRMADFAAFVLAAEEAFPHPPGTFMAAYEANIDERAADEVDQDDLIAVIAAFLVGLEGVEWSGSASDLRDALAKTLDRLRTGGSRPYASVPELRTPKALSEALRRRGPLFRAAKFELVIGGKDPDRRTTIYTLGKLDGFDERWDPEPDAESGGRAEPQD